MRANRSTAIRALLAVTTLWLIALPRLAAQPIAPPAVTVQGAVATVHPQATDAARQIMLQGGNAIDGAVAAALMLGVVDGHNSGIGGGCFILIRLADGEIVAIDGRETAPQRATRDMYLHDGQPQPEWSQTGALAVGVPGALAAYEMAVERWGQRSLAKLLEPSIQVAEAGFVVDANYAQRLRESAEALRQFPGSRAMLLHPDGQPYRAGERLKLKDLAETYRQISRNGSRWFYQGPFAERLGQWMHDQGGILTASDLANYQPRQRSPVVSRYRDYTIVGFPPPSSGGVHVAQILNILEHFDLQQLYQQDPALWVHVIAQAMERAFADRAYWLGDPDFAAVPLGLIDKDYAARLAQQIRMDRRVPVESHGMPPEWQQRHFPRHTTHIAVADRLGNWVSITTTVNTTFGSKVVVPGTGVVLNNQMDDFAIAPGQPNAFGLIGAESNSVAAGKRPLSSMSPTLVLKDGQPILTIGAAGGPTIISQVVLGLVRVLDLQQSLEQAVAAPRFHHQWVPDQLLIEPRFSPGLRIRLTELGHRLQVDDSIGVMQAIGIRQGQLVGVHDPRVPGKAASW